MDIKCKCMIFEPQKKHLFLDISSTNTDTLAPSLYQCVETRSLKIFYCYLSHFCTTVSTSSSSTKYLSRFSTQLWTALRNKHFHRKQEASLYAYPLYWVFLPTKKINAQKNDALWLYTPQARSPFCLLQLASERTHARLLPRLSWNWTILLPSDIHRKPSWG
jgi:hypothetical protein